MGHHAEPTMEEVKKVTKIQELQEVCRPVMDYIEQHKNEISEVAISRNRITARKEVMLVVTVPEETISKPKRR